MKFFFSKNENGHEVAEEIVMVSETLDVPSVGDGQLEIVSAIALALQMYTYSAMEEKKILSAIQNSMKAHSPWSCKSNALRQQPLYQPNLKRK